MAGCFLITVLAAFGCLSVLWAAFGWLLPVCREGCLVYQGRPGAPGFLPAYLWLRSMGLVRCTLIVVDLGFEEPERTYLTEQGIEIYSLEELPQRLGIGANTT